MDINIEGATLGSALREVAGKRRNELFLTCEDDKCTYGEFLERVERISKGLLACGVQHGDRIALWAGNRIEWIECYLAVVSIGAVLVTVNTRYHAGELRYELAQSEASYLILEERFLKENLLERALSVIPEAANQEFGAIECASLPHFKGIVSLESVACPGAQSLEVIEKRGETISDELLCRSYDTSKPDDVALMIYTSGTTGTPKGVEQQHSSLLNRMRRFAVWNEMDEFDATFFALPLFHSFGAVVAVIGTLVSGSRLCMLEKFGAAEALRMIERERCSVIHGVPSSFYMMLKNPLFKDVDLSCGRTGVLGGAPCPPDLAREIREKIAPNIAAAWGLTESCGMVTASAPGDAPEQITHTVGRVIPGSAVVIAHPESGEVLAPGIRGEVLVESPYNMKGYYHMEEETRRAFDRKGRLRTGDLGFIDEDGCLRIVGRLKDMFIVGGVNAYPTEIENHLRTLDGVDDVQVVGVPDERLGEVACAYVVRRAGSTVGVEDIIEHCRTLANYKIPRYVRFVEEFPLTANGKVKKYELRDWFASSKAS